MNAPTVPIRLPVWLEKYFITALVGAVFGLVSFGIVGFVSNIGEQRSQNERLMLLEKEMEVVRAEQRVNSDYRIHMEDFEARYREDYASLLEGQREILRSLKVHQNIHEGQTP